MELLFEYWNWEMVGVNLLIVCNLLGALLCGLIVGYERSYHGRAAGMRTYGLVCMASCAMTVFAGYPLHWFGGTFGGSHLVDPTRVIQGIVTGIGFLGAGVIMKDGLSISGLTTAASIWTSSAIGILVGLGFYSAAVALTLISAGLMLWGGKIEAKLPSQPGIAIQMRFKAGYQKPEENVMRKIALDRGYVIANGSFSIGFDQGCLEWSFVAVAVDGASSERITDLAEELSQIEGIEKFHISHARN